MIAQANPHPRPAGSDAGASMHLFSASSSSQLLHRFAFVFFRAARTFFTVFPPPFRLDERLSMALSRGGFISLHL